MSAEAEDYVAAVRETGLAVIPSVIPPAAVAAVRESVLATTLAGPTPRDRRGVGKYSNLLRQDHSLAEYLTSRAVLDVVEALLGAPLKITFTTSQTNFPGTERGNWCVRPHSRRWGDLLPTP